MTDEAQFRWRLSSQAFRSVESLFISRWTSRLSRLTNMVDAAGTYTAFGAL